ncbi:MAG: xylulose kinase [Herpetosiphonaceae bacterium]|nr:xylulose kinase [Herpetosiphonaceae bacterium]
MTPQPPYVLGIDGGTNAIKVGLYDLRGNRIGYGACPYSTTFSHPGWAEQSPNDWWDGLVQATRACLAEAAVPPEEVIALSADATTCTLVLLDGRGQHIGPALLWMDVRASAQAEQIFATGDSALRYSLAGCSAEWMPPKMLWLQQHEPERYAAAHSVVEYVDWLGYRLTGKLALNINTITQRWFYDRSTGGWPLSFFEAIGLGDLHAKLPKEVLPLGDVLGGLQPEAADALQLPVGIPVAVNGGDAFVSLLGLRVVEPGDLGLITGSSNVLAGLSAERFHHAGIFGAYPDAVLPGLFLVEGGQASTGSVLAWLRDHFAKDLLAQSAATGISAYTLLEAEAEQVPVGSDGLVVLDYFQGNRTPHTDSLARGAMWGLSLQTGRGHVYRAMMEGIAYGTRAILQTFKANNYVVKRIVASGGATRSPLFMQIYADVTGVPIVLTEEPEATLLSSAILAAYAAGAFASLPEASTRMVRPSASFVPDPARHDRYDAFYQFYAETYPQLRALMHRMSGFVAQAN